MKLRSAIWSELNHFLTRQAPDLVTGCCLPFLAVGLILAVCEITWAFLSPLSIDEVPDLNTLFLVMSLVNGIVLATWILWPRYFSVADRFGHRSSVLEYADLLTALVATALVVALPYWVSTIMTSRVASLRTDQQLKADLTDIQHALGHGLLREASFGYTLRSELNLLNAGKAQSVSAVPTVTEAAQRARSLAQSGGSSEIATDVKRLFETSRSYDPALCTAYSLPHQSKIVSEIIRYGRYRPDDATAASEVSEHNLARLPYRCLAENRAPLALNMIVQAKSWERNALVFRQTGVIAFGISLAFAAVTIVYLLGTKVHTALWGIFMRLYGLAVLAGLSYGAGTLLPAAASVFWVMACLLGIHACYLMFIREPYGDGAIWDVVVLSPVIALAALAVIALISSTVEPLLDMPLATSLDIPLDVLGFEASKLVFFSDVAQMPQPFVTLAFINLIFLFLLRPLRSLRIRQRSVPR